MKVKEILNKLGKLESSELLLILQFIGIVADLPKEDQKVISDLFELLEKKIDENFIKKPKKRRKKK